ncbi:hypothetical protein HDV00_006401, partial [Rhizophlyctis rosea]
MFSSFTALTGGSEGLGFGALLGAATFITMCVVGSVAIVAPFKLPRRPFIRDVVSFIGAITFIIIITADGKITSWESYALIVYYLCYVGIVIVGAWIYGKQKAARVSQQQIERIEEGEGSEGEEEIKGVIFVPFSLSVTHIYLYKNVGPSDIEDDTPHSHTPFFETETDALLPSSPHHTPTTADALHVQNEEDFDADFYPHFPPTRLSSYYSPHSPFPTPRPSTLKRALSERQGVSPRAVVGMLTPAVGVEREDYFGRFAEPLVGISRGGLTTPGGGEGVGSGEESSSPGGVMRHPTGPFALDESSESESMGRARSPSLSVGRWVRGRREPERWRVYVYHLFPFLSEWRSLTILEKMMEIVTSPVTFLLSLSIPVVHREEMELERNRRRKEAAQRERVGEGGEEDFGRFETTEDEEGEEGDAGEGDEVEDDMGGGVGVVGEPMKKETVALQALVLPVFVGFTPFGGEFLFPPTYIPYPFHIRDMVSNCIPLSRAECRPSTALGNTLTPLHIPVWLICLAVGCALVGLVFKLPVPPIRYGRVLSVIGFGVSMCWIYLIANEVVGLLEAVGLIAGISESVLGLTVFAMGNSIGDLITNINIARMGYPAMAVGACFGGPML